MKKELEKREFEKTFNPNKNNLLSLKHKVYARVEDNTVQISPPNSILTRSFVLNTLTNDCSLRCGSLDQIAPLIESANARKSTSSGSGNKVAFSRNSSYSDTLMNSIDSSTSFCLISNSCSESLDLNKHSDLCFLSSDFRNSGAENPTLIDENRYELTDRGFMREKNMLLSNTSLILIYYKDLPFFKNVFSNFSLISGDTSESSLLNLPFFAFLPNLTDHLMNSCSSLEFNLFNSNSTCLSRSSNLSLTNSDQLTQRNLDILDLSSGSTANVILAIYTSPLAFNSSNFCNSLILLTIALRATAATLTSGNSFLNLANSSSGTDTVTLGILSTSNNYFNISNYVNILKSFDSAKPKSKGGKK